jgi:DNA-3-methyladenine glycosylase
MAGSLYCGVLHVPHGFGQGSSWRLAPGPAERRRLLAGLGRGPLEAAPWLLGKVLVRRRGRTVLAVRIVETEAYLGEGDAAAHVFRGRTPRTEPLYGPPGTLYVYFVYGMHHCLNLAVDRLALPGSVLIRAAEPLDGGLSPLSCRGPGRLCRALGLDTRDSGRHLFDAGASLTLREGAPPRRIAVSPRVGIRRGADLRLRFYDADSAAVSGLPRRGGSESRVIAARRPPGPLV